MVKKTICIIYDGLGDRPIPQFGGKTPLEAASTPNLDSIASKSICGLMHTLGRGIRPGSDTSHLELFGYPMEQYYTGRGPIEVAGLGIKLNEGDVAFRGNMGSVDDNWLVEDRRAGRIRDVSQFARAIDGIEIDGIKFIVKPGTAHRAGVVLRGPGLSANISANDPGYVGQSILEVKPLDDTKEAAFTAQVLNKFMRKSYEILNDMEANKDRKKQGEFVANFLLLRGAGVYPSMPTFEEKYGLKACCIAGGGLYKGVGAFLGMDLIEVDGANALPDSNIEGKFVKALEVIEEYDFVFIHVKAADSLAEDGNPEGKKAFIDKCDVAMKHFVNLPDDVMLVVTADHSTASELMAHTAEPVPVLFSNPSVRVDGVSEFSERGVMSGGLGHIQGKDIMPQVMDMMGKLPKVGA